MRHLMHLRDDSLRFTSVDYERTSYVTRFNVFARISIALLSAALVSFAALLIVLYYADGISVLAYFLGGITLLATLGNLPIMVFAGRETVEKAL